MELLASELKQKRDPGNGASPYDLLASATYDSEHQPLPVTDASGKTTQMTYDALGRLSTVVTPARNGPTGVPLTLAERTTTYSYYADTALSGAGRLQQVTDPSNPSGSSISQYEYDAYGRLRRMTAPDGRHEQYEYDGLDRPTRTVYDDGTYEETSYSRLDAEGRRDRLGRWSHTFHDALRRPTATRDALGRTTTMQWCTCGSLDKLIVSPPV